MRKRDPYAVALSGTDLQTAPWLEQTESATPARKAHAHAQAHTQTHMQAHMHVHNYPAVRISLVQNYSGSELVRSHMTYAAYVAHMTYAAYVCPHDEATFT